MVKTQGRLQLLDQEFYGPSLKRKGRVGGTGAIKDEILDIETLALKFIEFMKKSYPELLEKRYKIVVEGSPLETMEAIGRKRGCIIRGGEIDKTKVSNLILDEFRKGVLGRISLELPEE